MKSHLFKLIGTVMLILLPIQGMAGPRFIEDKPNFHDQDPDNIKEREAWKEQETANLPPNPKEDDLLEFELDGPKTGFRYFVDTKSLALGKDGVIRYTLVIRSHQGAQNIYYEGMHCSRKEYKTYAFGTGVKPLKAMRNPKWRPINTLSNTPYRKQLREHYFCDLNRAVPLTAKEIIDSLKYKQKVFRPWGAAD